MKQFAVVADENIAFTAIKALRGMGYSVASVAEQMPGAADETVLRHASTSNAVMLTFDRDYGELIFKRNMAAPLALLYLRSIPASPAELTVTVEGLLSGRLAGDIAGYFVVWTREGIRKRAFPRPG